jgi:hypothetical protein
VQEMSFKIKLGFLAAGLLALLSVTLAAGNGRSGLQFVQFAQKTAAWLPHDGLPSRSEYFAILEKNLRSHRDLHHPVLIAVGLRLLLAVRRRKKTTLPHTHG